MPWTHPQCSAHHFCIPCVKEYVEHQISESKVERIMCPGKDCTAEFTDKMIADLVDQSYFEKYQRFKQRAELLKNGNIRWCPTPNCEGRMESTDKKTHVTCPLCGFEMCFKCGGKWHGKKSCETAMDHEFKAYIKEHEVQKCPKCKRPVEKADGCNHMTCAACHYEFCWLCGGAYLGGAHFNPLNPLGCAGLQGGYNEKRNWPMWKIYGLRFLKLLLLLLIVALSPLALVLICPCYVAISFNRRLWNTHCFAGSLRTVLIFTIAFIISIPCIALLIPLFFLFCIFYALRECHYICS